MMLAQILAGSPRVFAGCLCISNHDLMSALSLANWLYVCVTNEGADQSLAMTNSDQSLCCCF